jgi:hypothetical protein
MSESGVADQLRADVATLRQVFEGFERLEAMYQRAYVMMSPQQRGYFTPDEDDEVRRMLLAYRNYRLACWDVIWRRHLEYRGDGDPVQRLRGFILGYAAAVRLYQKSLRLIEIAEFDRLLRAKLNEPDRKFDLEGGFFEDVLVSYSSLYNYVRMLAAGYHWAANRRRVRQLGLEADPTVGWLVPLIVRERKAVRGKFWLILGKRLRRDWRAAWRTLFKPVALAGYASRAGIASVVANLRIKGGYVRGIGPRTLEHLAKALTPGDVLLVRAEDKITSALLPGFWAHAALYVGRPEALARLGLLDHPRVARLQRIFERLDPVHGLVIEAVPRGCRVHTLEYCLRADHVAVLRPNLGPHELRESLVEAFSHVGKPYDFEFDFNVTSRIVCTELIYRSLHGRGPIRFELIRRLGRFTLSADDIVEQHLAAAAGAAPFRVVELLLKEDQSEARQVPPAERLSRLAGQAAGGLLQS